MDIVGKRKIFLIISLVITIISLIAIIVFGFKLSIEFTGGSVTQIRSAQNSNINADVVRKAYIDNGIDVVSVVQRNPEEVTVRTETISDDQKNQVFNELNKDSELFVEESFNTLGPVVGEETRNNALIAVGLAIVAITLYIAFAFRKVSQPVSSWKFGISAIIALVYDVLTVLGAFAIFGYFLNVEIDTLFITAILTIMGFSVHDTIVVFDRIRENLIKNVSKLSFDELVNKSFIETLGRSLNTSITVVFVLFALLLFGGESIRWFIAAFLIGIVSGTYSSIFIASGLLVEWNELDKKGFKFPKFPKKKKS